MKLILILAGPYSACISTEDIWSVACAAQGIEIETYNIDEQEGENIANKYNLNSFPALIYEDKIIAVGHPSKEEAHKIIKNLPVYG